jgi:hypothetical protein
MPMTAPQLRAGNGETYATIREWRLRGTNREIGLALGLHGRDELKAAPAPCPDESRIRAQRGFFKTHFRPFHERMIGVADAFGLPVEQPTHDLAALWFDVQLPSCSAGFVPAKQTENGHSHVIRNMDLGVDLTGDVEHPASSRILALTMVPDEGYASSSAVVFDLMGAMDGINEKGLVVICNSHGDYRLVGGFQPTPAYWCEPVRHPEPGLNELQVVRYLLDMCADTDEAKEALLSLRTYYAFTPSLYLIADARGRSVVFQKSPAGNRIIFTERDGEPLVVTNFAPSRFESDQALPEGDGLEQGFVYTRYRIMRQGIEETTPLTRVRLTGITRAASFDALCEPLSEDGAHPVRTVYTSIYDIEARSMSLSCYLGEADAGTVHSDPVTFVLSDAPGC